MRNLGSTLGSLLLGLVAASPTLAAAPVDTDASNGGAG
jgi:hypothetical protein